MRLGVMVNLSVLGKGKQTEAGTAADQHVLSVTLLALLLASGLILAWWPLVMREFCFSLSTQWWGQYG